MKILHEENKLLQFIISHQTEGLYREVNIQEKDGHEKDTMPHFCL